MMDKFPNQLNYLVRIAGGVLVFSLIWNVGACSPQTAPMDAEVYPAIETTPTPRSTQSLGGSTTPVQQSNGAAITFYKDILPLLRTNLPDRQYECTQCHPAYVDPKVVAKALIVDDIIASVESGFMPMNEGPRMRKDEIELLKLWRRSGMQVGTPTATPAPQSNSATGTR